MMQNAPHLTEPVPAHARKDFAVLGAAEMTIAGALDAIRQRGIGEKIVYLYVVDREQRLVGVVPTHRLLTASVEQRLTELTVSRVVAVSQTATLLDACELFVLHRFLAFPVVVRSDWLSHQLQKKLVSGDSWQGDGLTFTVLQIRPRRAHRVLVEASGGSSRPVLNQELSYVC